MKKIIAIFLCALSMLCVKTSLAQTSKGFSIAKPEEKKAEGKTYALIVGISKYQNPSIPQLQFADRDAMAFRNYLVAAGVDSNNVTLLINEKAKYSDILLDLDDLCTNKVQKGDKVYFYFSGHGDVESHVVTNDGYLLPYDAPKAVYAISAIKVQTLQSYIATLSSKGVQAIVITDACHSGNLAGGIEGLQNISNVLKDKWQDEIKILSCQPGELSLEGKQWGEGRGLFSYELINGISGLADKNKDGKVSLLELNIYLMEKVPEESNPLPQTPMLSGNMSATVAMANPKLLADIAAHQTPTVFAKIDTRGLDESLLKNLNDSIKDNYHLFKTYMDSGIYFTSHNTLNSPCAYHYYMSIPENDSTKLLVALMKREMSAVFMNDATKALELITNNKIWQLGRRQIKSLMDEMIFLRNALGDEKLRSLSFLQKAMFFQIVPDMAGEDTALKRIGLNKLDSAIVIDPNAPYLHLMRGLGLERLGQHQDALNAEVRAIQLSPGFVYPYLELGEIYYETQKYDSSLLVYDHALALDTEEARSDVYQGKGKCWYQMGKQDSAEYYFNKVIGSITDENDSLAYADQYFTVGNIYFELKDYKKAIPMYMNAIKYKPKSKNSRYVLACTYSLLNEKKNALQYLEQSFSNGWNDYDHLQADSNLDNIRKEPEFTALLKKYFPDQTQTK